MCGINILFGIHDTQKSREIITRMNSCMAHRGPDNDGIFTDTNIALGHRRLSIIDLSTAGNQPMMGLSGRYQIVYNGEFYNYREVKQELEKLEKPYQIGRAHV